VLQACVFGVADGLHADSSRYGLRGQVLGPDQ
jgi:hypothetical protein